MKKRIPYWSRRHTAEARRTRRNKSLRDILRKSFDQKPELLVQTWAAVALLVFLHRQDC
ncbi:hypothetical protein NIES4074_19930 [Cylindrospermum sp. NIES-4074]|nr:hypothetical protein NIES4074_19930 [Cylindrospermum sp. NIES-4074]